MLVTGIEGLDLNAQTEDLILNRAVGGIILFEHNFETPEQLSRLIRDLQKAALSRPPCLPLFISVDQEGGRVARLKAPFTTYPDPACLGKAKSESLAHRFGLALGKELSALGINMDYAPVLDVNTNPKNPIIGNRAFSDQPDWVARLGGPFIRGMQESGVIPVGKHFPGHGDTSQDSHLELPYVKRDADALQQVELPPFARAVEQGLEVLMTAHVIYSAWDEKFPATFSKFILQEILRKQLGFQGLIISDDLEMKAVEKHFPFEQLAALGINAGIDLFLICHDTDKIKALQDHMICGLDSGQICADDVTRSVERIIALKKRIPDACVNPGNSLSSLANEHRKLAEEMQSHLG